MTQQCPEFDVLDYSINKTERRMTFSTSYKRDFSSPRKFDLSPLFIAERNRQHTPRGNAYFRHKDRQSFERNQDVNSLKEEHNKPSYPMDLKPNYDGLLTTSVDKTKADIALPGSMLDPLPDIPVLHRRGYQQHVDGDDKASSTDGGTNVMFKDDIKIMDNVYLNYLLDLKEKTPNSRTLYKELNMLIQKMSADNKDDDDPKDKKIDNVSVFVPGQPWLSQAQRRTRNLSITMDQIEHSILRKNADAYEVAYEILLYAEEFEKDGGNLKQEIRKVLDDAQKEQEFDDSDKEEEDGETENSKDLFQQVKDKQEQNGRVRNQIVRGTMTNLMEAFTILDKKLQEQTENFEKVGGTLDKMKDVINTPFGKMPERKEHFDSKQENSRKKQEDINQYGLCSSNLFGL